MDKKTSILIHAGIIMILLVLPLFLYVMVPYEIPGAVKAISVITSVYSFLVFYFGYLFFSGWILGDEKPSRKLLLLLITLFIIYGIKLITGLLVDIISDHELRKYAHFKWWVIAGDLVNNTVMLFIGVLARIGSRYLDDHRKQSEIKIQKQNQELAFLKAQINPHFFFNTLNNIYSLVYKKSDDAPAALLKLSDIMRYMLYDSKSDLVSLDQELLHLNNYLELERLRFSDPRFVDFQIHGDSGNWQIPPMLLLSFVENAFKHGRRRAPNPGIEILLHVESDQLSFRVVNYLKDEKNGDQEGIGLANTRRRLELLYPDCHQFEIVQTDERFKITLHIACKAKKS